MECWFSEMNRVWIVRGITIDVIGVGFEWHIETDEIPNKVLARKWNSGKNVPRTSALHISADDP
jgi:hypothetical protein